MFPVSQSKVLNWGVLSQRSEFICTLESALTTGSCELGQDWLTFMLLFFNTKI